jgi:hypothetical protein
VGSHHQRPSTGLPRRVQAGSRFSQARRVGALIPAGFVLAACGGGGSSCPIPSSAGAVDACAIVPAASVSSVLTGVSVVSEHLLPVSGIPQDGTCERVLRSANGTQAHSYYLSVEGSGGLIGYNSDKDRDTKNGDAVTVNGLGEQAYWRPRVSTLEVLTGDTKVSLQVMGEGQGAVTQLIVIALGKLCANGT